MLEYIANHFIELFLICGFFVGIFAFKLTKEKRSIIVYGILISSLAMMIYDYIIKKNNLPDGTQNLLFILVCFNVYLCSLIVFPIKLKYHVILAIPFVLSSILSFVVSNPIIPVFFATILYFVGIIIYCATKVKNNDYKLEYLASIFFSFINLGCVLLQFFVTEEPILNNMIIISTIILYVIHYSRKYNLTKVAEEKRIQTQRTSIAISQIQPHFLYNSLATIGYICKKDAVMASEAIDKFSDYLRANLNSLKQDSCVPFKEEFKHVETYLWLEKLRFEDRLEIELDIQFEDFLVPPLSIQPLVENAVKHGICNKIEGGKLTIRTVEYAHSVMIMIQDTGVGFDTKAKPNDGKTHVGIENVKSRIQDMANGELTIKSAIGKGTTSIITLPKEIR